MFTFFLTQDHYKTVTDALSLFKDDPLLSIPGTNYLYTTHGWTLVSAVIERAANQDFLLFMKKLFKDLGMESTCADFHDKIVHNRARYYWFFLLLSFFTCKSVTLLLTNKLAAFMWSSIQSEYEKIAAKYLLNACEFWWDWPYHKSVWID